MNFKSFQINTTNIFPCSNDTKGGQLLTEYNLKSRDCIDTDESISYNVGRSAVHSESDFNVTGNNGTLTISEGKGVINGHFIESLVPITIDLLSTNESAIKSGKSRLTGTLCVGLRVYYSTESTMAGAMKTADESGQYYEGIQVVILPQSEFKTPEDVPTEESKVTAHIKLATFNFTNGTISNLQNNTKKCQSIPASRIKNIADVITDDFASTKGLKSNRYYTIRGKGATDTSSNTWCDSTDALMVWDNNVTSVDDSSEYEKYISPGQSAKFIVEDNKAKLYIPHKQISGKNNKDTSKYKPVRLELPIADYENDTPGVVDWKYTNIVKNILKTCTDRYIYPNGKLLSYIDTLSDRSQLPTSALTKDMSGYYVLVKSDTTVSTKSEISDYLSTMYVVINSYEVTSGELHEDINTIYVDAEHKTPPVRKIKYATVIVSVSDVNSITTAEHEIISNLCNTIFNQVSSIWDLYDSSKDALYAQVNIKDTNNNHLQNYYYIAGCSRAEIRFSDPIILSGISQLATQDTIGGFRDISSDMLDQGYVKLDDNGNLKLLDYELLRTGVLAYQLGEDVNIDNQLTNIELQSELDDKVNERVAFPNYSKRVQALSDDSNQNIIDVYIYLHQESTSDNENATSQVTIFDIDSRFNCAVRINIDGDTIDNSIDNSDKVTLNIVNCQKIMLNISEKCNANINLIDSCLYYDANVLSRLDNIRGLKLWYERFTEQDPYLVVDGMTVSAPNNIKVIESTEFWSSSSPSDVHFKYSLAGLTFSDTGDIINFDVYIAADITNLITTGISVHTFQLNLPQSEEFAYPKNRLHPMKLNGSFVAAYIADNGDNCYISNITFGALTTESSLSGSISFYLDTKLIPSNTILGDFEGILPAWEDSRWNVFRGNIYGGVQNT